MVCIEKIFGLERVKSILAHSGSRSLDGIKIQSKSEIPLFFKNNGLESLSVFKSEEYLKAINYVEEVLRASASPYKSGFTISGKYKFSERDLQKHYIKLRQMIGKEKTKLLEMEISFRY